MDKEAPINVKKRKKPLEIIRNFTPSWFSVNMGTGILSILLYNFPFQFRGLRTIALVVFIMNVVLFCIFLLTTIIRYVLFPTLLKKMLKNDTQSLFVGTLPMGLTTITNFCVIALLDKKDWAHNLAFVLWCIQFALTVLTCIVVPYCFFVYHDHELEKMNATWLLPFLPAIVTAASGGLISQFLHNQEHAFMILIMSYALMGLGMMVAYALTVIYICRLTLHKLPSKEVIVSSFIPLGPLGQGPYGMIQLGTASKKLFGDRYISGLGTVAQGLGFILALSLWGFGAWYLWVATFSIGRAVKQRIPFNLGWWGLIFPIGVFTTATLSIGTTLDSMFFLVLAAILTCVLVLLWLFIVAMTLIGVFTTEVFCAPCLTPVLGDN